MSVIQNRIRNLAEKSQLSNVSFDTMDLLKQAGLRPTRQRLSIASHLFSGAHRHITVEGLHSEVTAQGFSLSVATVYNALNQFAAMGLVRKMSIEGERTWYDTDTEGHQHFYVESEDRIIDIPVDRSIVGNLPDAPPGYVVSKVDVVVRLLPVHSSNPQCSGAKQMNCSACGSCNKVCIPGAIPTPAEA